MVLEKTELKFNTESTLSFNPGQQIFMYVYRHLSQIIAPQPAQLLHIDKWSISSNVTLADPTFNRPANIDILFARYWAKEIG